MTRVVISQPMYFPWPGFFEQMMLADVYIWLDDAQFSKGSFTNRIQVNINGRRKWMTIPLEGKGNRMSIAELRPAGDAWIASHREMLRQSLSRFPARAAALEIFDRATSETSLVDCLIQSATLPASYIGIAPGSVRRSSEIGVTGASWQRVLDLVKAVGGTAYITGHGAAAYMDHEAFEREGVTVEYMDYSKTPWGNGNDFVSPYVTILDLVAAEGKAARDRLHPRTVGWRQFLDARG
ncbi:MAG: WbqC family protein [Parvibaculum sp.]|uniref:WbqC family protein n=1 Tax=Parvibaculum sp. TaxID=2024848 RepID=UPI002ABCB475|nr:WbqC family protein [Parvibaculum sp.]MDZ4381591.1 WbqC family protein [Parvibaculum sp.]